MADTNAAPAPASDATPAPTLPAHAPVDATAVPPAATTTTEPKKETETTTAAAVPAAAPVPEPTTTAAATMTEAKIDANEPQNPLTEKFTEAEWKALKVFKVRIVISLHSN